VDHCVFGEPLSTIARRRSCRSMVLRGAPRRRHPALTRSDYRRVPPTSAHGPVRGRLLSQVRHARPHGGAQSAMSNVIAKSWKPAEGPRPWSALRRRERLVESIQAGRSAVGNPQGNEAKHRVTRNPASHHKRIPRRTCGEPQAHHRHVERDQHRDRNHAASRKQASHLDPRIVPRWLSCDLARKREASEARRERASPPPRRPWPS
jgi:hypothetical protein